MKYFYLYIFLLLCFIFAISYLNTYLHAKYSNLKESFNSNKQSFILLGDSILKNNAYVSDGKSVDQLLEERTNGKSICLAKDDSKIVSIYSQIERIPDSLDSATIFLSAGGNDILEYYTEQEKDTKETGVLNPMFSNYKKLVESIRNKVPNANIVLLDIYYPDNLKYKQYHPIISEWNNKIYDYAKEPQNMFNTSVLRISSILTQPEDFSFGIEPSANGSQKLVDTMLSSY